MSNPLGYDVRLTIFVDGKCVLDVPSYSRDDTRNLIGSVMTDAPHNKPQDGRTITQPLPIMRDKAHPMIEDGLEVGRPKIDGFYRVSLRFEGLTGNGSYLGDMQEEYIHALLPKFREMS